MMPILTRDRTNNNVLHLCRQLTIYNFGSFGKKIGLFLYYVPLDVINEVRALWAFVSGVVLFSGL